MWRTKSDRSEWVVLGLILLMALAIRIHFFVGASLDDDLGFTGNASILSQGIWITGNDQSLRKMTFAPIALAYRLFGVNTFSTHVFHMLYALITIVTAFFLARRFGGRIAGACAAIFLAVVPLHVFFSSRIMPSLPETMWGGLALWLFCWAEDRRRIGDTGRLYAANAITGFLIGIAYLCRETGAVALTVPIAYLMLEAVFTSDQRCLRTSQTLVVLGGFLAVLGFESVTYYCSTHDWLHRWHVVHRAQALPDPRWPPWDFYLAQLLNMTQIKTLSWNLPTYTSLGLMGWAILASLPPFARRSWMGPKKVIWLWFFAYFFFLSFGAASLSPYTPIRKFHRYQMLYLTPGAVMVGCFLASLWRWRAGRAVALVAGLFLVGSGMYYTSQTYKWYRAYHRGVVEFRRMISQRVDPGLPIYVDNFESAIFNLWDGYRSIYRFQGLQSLNAPPTEGAYVEVIRRRTDHGIVMDYPNKDFMLAEPAHWIKIGDVQLGYWDFFKLGCYPSLYYVPPQESPRKRIHG